MDKAAKQDDERSVKEHDRDFHAVLLGMSGNQRLADYVSQLRDMVVTRGATSAGPKRSLHTIVNEHREILERVSERDASGAARLMRDHIARTGQILLEIEGHDVEMEALSWAPYVDAALDPELKVGDLPAGA